MDLRGTLNLPDADFTIPMKADLPNLEPRIQKIWADTGIYHRVQQARADAPVYVLHDGPAYTNSPIHIGTALNKTLKDFVTKSRTMMGFRCPYVPGFDNHGLPIEQAAMKKFELEKRRPTDTELRTACRAHATEFIQVQSVQFQRLGVFGLWERPYTTMGFRYEAELVRIFGRLIERGYIYKGLRPTLWSTASQTALADTEIVYQEHTSTAIYVRFPLKHDHNGFSQGLSKFYIIIWTTTPWTIPANLAVAFNPTALYAIVRVGEDHYLIGVDLVERVAQALGWTEYSILAEELGASFEGSSFKHPIYERDSICVMADYVTMDDGTGVVHTAPSHGRDDFYTGQRYGLPVPNTVDERGYLTDETGEFAGTFYKDCDTVVVDRLREVGALLDSRPYVHSYPHAERDGKPVIFRATEQWFMKLDHEGLREGMLEQIGEVKWYPANGQNRIDAMVRNRPDWCISRQRPWGVGIPIFYGAKSREPVFDSLAFEMVAEAIERDGSEAWFSKDPSELLPENYEHPTTGETEFVKETDVLDVWFDSGATSICVLEGEVEPLWKERWPADLYLEGSDQHRGWFNSSLILGLALNGKAPYQAVLTHNFVNDEQGRKMSKRLGNIVDPVKVCDTLGADILRYWVASVDYTNDVPCSENLLKVFGENYRRVRNTLRFLMGNLQGFSRDTAVEMMELDRWIVEQADLLADDCVAAYERFDFDTAIRSVHDFCVNQLSKVYLGGIKDRMYCDGPDSIGRQSGQAACFAVLVNLTKLIAPILCHTSEEIWMRLGDLGLLKGEELHTVHAQVFDRPSKERLIVIEANSLEARYAAILEHRESVFAAFEAWKVEASVKDSQDVVLGIREQGDLLNLLRSFTQDELAILFKMSFVDVQDGPSSATFSLSGYEKCDRCRRRLPDVATVGEWSLCDRCRPFGAALLGSVA